MTKTLEQAIAQIASLPEAEQDKIGRELLAHVEKLRNLRTDIEQGLRSLESGAGKPLDINDIIRRARALNAKP
jgi:hypothetical protein